MFDNVRKVLNEFGNLLVDTYRDKLTKEKVNASKTLYNSISYIVEGDGANFIVKLKLEDYWRKVEEGTKPKEEWVSTQKLIEWIKIKPVIPRPFANGKLPTTKHLANLISRKIYFKGIKPRPLLQQSIDDVFDEIKERLEEALIKDIESEFEIIKGIMS